MSLTNENGNMVMPVSPMYGNGYGGGLGGFGGDGFWIILLFLLIGNNGWGNGYGGGGTTYVANDVQRGFDQASLTSGINGISSAMCNGFSNVQQSLCNGFAGVNGAIANGFAQSEISANARQMADMQQNFSVQSALQNCCCENRASVADLKYTVATEACNDRQAVTNALFDVTAQNNANTSTLINTINSGFQSIKDQMCDDKMAAKDELISELRQRLYMQDLATSQTAQTAQLIADNAAQTQYVVNRVAPYPVPSYSVPNPYAGVGNYGCNNCCGYGVA